CTSPFVPLRGGDKQRFSFRPSDSLFAGRTSPPRPLPIERTPLHASKQIGRRLLHARPRPPKPDKRLLHHILRIRPTANKLPREQHQGRPMTVEPGLPVVVRISHRRSAYESLAT